MSILVAISLYYKQIFLFINNNNEDRKYEIERLSAKYINELFLYYYEPFYRYKY